MSRVVTLTMAQISSISSFSECFFFFFQVDRKEMYFLSIMVFREAYVRDLDPAPSLPRQVLTT